MSELPQVCKILTIGRTWCSVTLPWAYFALLCFTDTAFFLQIVGLWQPCIKQVYRHHFSNDICSLYVSVSHFGNSSNISNFFIISIFVMVICDQWSLMLYCKNNTTCWRLRWWLAFFSNKVFLYVHLFRHNAIAHLTDYSIV